MILTKFHNFDQISGFQPKWTMLIMRLLTARGLKTQVAGWHCHPEDLGPSGRFWVMIFWKPARKIRLNSQNYVWTVQNMSGQFKMCPYSSKFILTAQNMSGEYMFFVDGERLLCIFLVRCKRYLRVFHPEDFLVPPGRFRVFSGSGPAGRPSAKKFGARRAPLDF